MAVSYPFPQFNNDERRAANVLGGGVILTASHGHGWELLCKGTGTLACGKGAIKERLIRAFGYGLHGMEEEELPPHIWERFSRLLREVTGEKPVGDEGSIEASVNRMPEDRAAEIAEEVFDMFLEVSRHYWADR